MLKSLGFILKLTENQANILSMGSELPDLANKKCQTSSQICTGHPVFYLETCMVPIEKAFWPLSGKCIGGDKTGNRDAI